MKRRTLSIITALALCLSLCPTWALAAEADPSLCKHHRSHTADCGYTAPTEGHDCGHSHADECYTEETLCVHAHDETCYSDGELPAEDEDKAADVCAHVCSAESGCVTRTLNCRHSHGSECGYVQPNPGTPCGYECKLCPIEALIAALPEQVTEDNADDARARLDEILALYGELTGDEQGQLDLTRVYALQEALAPANAPVTAAEEVRKVKDLDGLKAAVDAANNGGTVSVELETNISASNSQLISLTGGSLTLDLKGHKLSSDYNSPSHGMIEITDGTLVLKDSAGSGSIESTDSACAILVKGGAVTVESGAVSASTMFYHTIRLTGGSLEVAGGTITNSQGGYAISNEKGAASVTIRGGTVQGTGSPSRGVYMDHAQSSLTVLDGADISGDRSGIYISKAADVQIAGGSIAATGSDTLCRGLGIGNCTSIALSGGTFSGNGNAIWMQNPGSVGSLLKPAESSGEHWVYTSNDTVITPGPNDKVLSGPVTVAQCGGTMEQITVNDDGTHSQTCSDCGQVFTAPHTGTGTCEVCGAAIEYPVEVTVGGDTTQYTSLSLAWAALSGQSGTFKLLKDVTTSQTLTVSSGMDVTVEMLDGVTLTNSTADCFKVDGGTLTLASGTVAEGKSGSSVVYAKSGTLRMTGATCRSAGNGLWVDSNVTVQLSGGAISVPSEKTALRYQSKAVKDMLAEGCALRGSGSNLIALAQLGGDTLSGGDYTVGTCDSTERDIQSNGDGTHSSKCPYCSDAGEREACTYEFDQDGKGTCTVCRATGAAVAQVTIGETTTYYADIQSAWNAVGGQTATLTLLESADLGSGSLDLNSGDVTLEMAGDVVLTASTGNAVVYVDGGKLTLNSGTIENKYDSGGIGLQASGGVLEITGGTVKGYTAVMAFDGTVEVTGGTFTGTGTNGVGLQKAGTWDSTVQISGGAFSGTYRSVLNARSGETLADLLAEGYAFKQGDTWAGTSGNSLTGNVTVELAPVKIVQPTGVEVTYGTDASLSVVAKAIGESQTITYQWYQAGENSNTEIAGATAASYTASGLGAGTYQYYCAVTCDSYTVKSETVTVTVNPKQLTPTITGTTSKTYDGTTDCVGAGLFIQLDGILDGDIGKVTAAAERYAYDSPNAGKRTITASGITLGGDSKDNYTLLSPTATAYNVGTITKSTPGIAFKDTYNPDKTYDGRAIPNPTADDLTITGANFSDVKFTWDATPLNAGTYTLTAAIPETPNTEAVSAEKTVTISKAALTATGATITARAYQPDNVTADVSGVTFDGLKNGETLTLGTDYTATGTFADASAGTDKGVTVTVTLANTAKANNYQLSDSTCAATGAITKADPKVTNVSVSSPDPIYESASLGDIALTHGVGDTAGTVALNPSQTLTVGTKGYAWTFTPDDTNNYNTATGTISLIVAVDALQSIAVTTPPSKTAYTYGENFDKAGMVITATYASGATKVVTGEVQISPAELTVTTTALTITYQGKTVTQAITVSPKTVSAPTIELSPSSFVYDGTGKEPAVTVKDGEKMIPADEYTVGYSNNINAGTAIVTITNVAGNYTVSGTTTFPITAKPLTGAKVEVSGTFTYTGNALTPAPTVTLDGKTLTANTDYTVAYDKNTDAGAAKITVTGKGNYSGTAQGTFTIGRATLTVEGTGTASGTYGDKLSELAVSGLTAKLGATEISGTWKLTGGTVPNVGDSGEYTATFTPATGAGNYNALTAKVTLNIAKANYTGTTTASTSAKFGATGTYDLSALLPDGATVETAATTSNIFEGTPSVSDKTLSYTLKADAAVGSTGTITMPVTSTNYNDFDLTITVTVTAKDVPTLTVSPITVTYTGEAVPGTAIKGTAKVGSTTVPGTWAFASGEAVTNVADSGTKTVKFVPTDGTNYAEATATVVVTINKATPTGAPKYTAISTSGKTLADAGLTTEGSTLKPAGTVAWVLGTDTAVTANTQYEWTFTPTDTANYNTLTGKITLWPYTTPVNPGGGGGYVPSDPGGSSLPVTTTGQGSTTVTTTTTATPTASVGNGTATTTINTAMGNEIVKQAVANDSETVVIAPSVTGSVTKTEVSIPASTVGQIGSQTNASLTVSTPVADVTIPNGGLGSLGSAGGTMTVTAEQVGNSVELTVTAGGRTVQNVPGGVTLTVPAASTTPGTVAVLVHEDGTREVVRKSVADNGTVTIPLDGSAKLEIVDNSKYFADVPATSWAADAVAFASSHELFNGTSSTQFSPEQPMSRGMLAVVLHNLESNPTQALTGAFTDVDNSQWYAEGVAWAEAQGIIGGYGNGQFGPNDNITREQLAVMLWRYSGSPAATDRELHFADADKASGYALEALRWAVESGVMGGYGDGRLDPKGLATRAQVAQMLKNYLEK